MKGIVKERNKYVDSGNKNPKPSQRYLCVNVIGGTLLTQKFCDSGLDVMLGSMVAMFFPPPFTPFNLGGRCTGMAGGFRLFTGGGTGGADLLPDGEGMARDGAVRESGSGSDLTVFGEVTSYIPIESCRTGSSGRSCEGGVLLSRSCLDELLEATATFGKLLELSVLVLRMEFLLRSSTGGRRFSTLLADFNDFCLVLPESVPAGSSSRIKSTTGVLGMDAVFFS